MIKIAVVGLGKMGLSHHALVNAHPDVEVVGVCDSSSYVLGVLKKYTGRSDLHRLRRDAGQGRPGRRRDRDALQLSREDGSHRPRARSARLLREAVYAQRAGRRAHSTGVERRARSRHPGRLSQPLRRRLPRGQEASRGRSDRRGHPRPRRGLRARRAQAEGRDLAQPARPRAEGACTTMPPT